MKFIKYTIFILFYEVIDQAVYVSYKFLKDIKFNELQVRQPQQQHGKSERVLCRFATTNYNSGMRFQAAAKQFSVPKFYVQYIMEKSCKTKTITTLPGSGHKPKHSLGLKRKIMSTKITLKLC